MLCLRAFSQEPFFVIPHTCSITDIKTFSLHSVFTLCVFEVWALGAVNYALCGVAAAILCYVKCHN